MIVVHCLELKPFNVRERAYTRQVHLDPSPDDELEDPDGSGGNGVEQHRGPLVQVRRHGPVLSLAVVTEEEKVFDA
jgi:hypothetical protein